MQRGARLSRARRRLAVAATTLALIGAAAPAATAKVAPEPKPTPVKRTGLMVSVCKFSHRSSDDPIIYPNLPGASHSHDFFGNVTTDASSTPASLSGHGTSCDIAGDTAAYWAPTLLVNGAPVRPTALLAYYAVFGDAPVTPLPVGLEMVAGKDTSHVRFSSFRHSMATQATITMRGCKPGELMTIGINFPNCWNGTDLTSADGRSHMAYANNNVCPAGFPVLLPRLAIWLMYRAVAPGSTVTLSSGSLATAHADYINSWDPSTLSTLEQYCLAGHHLCYKQMRRVLKKLHLKYQDAKLIAGLGESAPDA